MHISSCTLVSLALSARAVAELTCGVSNGYDLGNPAYYYNDKDNLANFDACSATCKADSKCQSFAFGNSACLLYTEQLAANFREQLDSPYLFYDRNCLNIKSTPTAAPPPPESTTPPAATPTATQPATGATGASGASGASGVDTKPADASSAQSSPKTTDAAANSPSATNNAEGAAGASATTAAAEGTLVPAYLGASSGAASTATSASTLVTSSVSSSTRTSSATSSSGSTQASGSSTAASSADSGASELILGTWWSAVLVSVSLLAVFV